MLYTYVVGSVRGNFRARESVMERKSRDKRENLKSSGKATSDETKHEDTKETKTEDEKASSESKTEGESIELYAEASVEMTFGQKKKAAGGAAGGSKWKNEQIIK